MTWEDIFDRFEDLIRRVISTNSKFKGFSNKLDRILDKLDDMNKLIRANHEEVLKHFDFEKEDDLVLDMTEKVAEAKARIPHP